MFDPTSMQTPFKPAGPPPTSQTHGEPGLQTALVGKCLARARWARFIAGLFSMDGDESHHPLGTATVADELSEAGAILSIDEVVFRPLFVNRPSVDDLLDERNRLFGHTVRSSCPPYELEYGAAEVFQQSQRLADIAGFFAAFGFETSGLLAERPDHVVAQWEFLFVLALREAEALDGHRTEDAAICHRAQRSFLKDHAATWMPAFFERIRSADPSSFFLAAANVAERVLSEWCQALSVSIGARWIELRPISEEDSSITCGAPGEGTVELGPTLAAAMAEK